MKHEYFDPWNYAGKTHLLKFVLSGLPWNFLLKTQLGVCIYMFIYISQESNIFYNSWVPVIFFSKKGSLELQINIASLQYIVVEIPLNLHKSVL